MQTVDWSTIKKVHVIGVGGIGLSALARLLKNEGKIVTGCDRSPTIVTDAFVQEGWEVEGKHDVAHITPDTNLVIYSDAVHQGTEGYKERERAKELNIPELSYFEALGQLANQYKVVAVAGAHGKTTTTAMMIDVLEAGGLDPTGIVGSLRATTKSNFRAGKGEYFVVEADEYMRHFLNFTPRILVITNVDADHLDYYKDLADIQSAFRALAEKIGPDGYVVCNPNDPAVAPILTGLTCQVVDYKKFFDPNLPLKVLSLHRINAAAVLAVAEILKIDPGIAKKALADFAGTWRRFEYKGTTARGAIVYDDYGHHPTEVATTLKSVRQQFPDKNIIVAFHPHLYSRTKALMNEFATAFADADEVVLAPIFAAREAPDPTVSSDILAKKIMETGKDAHAVASLQEVADFIKNGTGEGDLVLTMGAGDIYKAGEEALR
jgi:UDP-N-acetylmuramate--alanine ligase